jgi:hypothetical protein
VKNLFQNFGVERVALVGFGTLAAVNILAMLLTILGRPGLGLWLQSWSRKHYLVAWIMPFIAGALVGHFFWATCKPGEICTP